mgnify:CR=1 FL=1
MPKKAKAKSKSIPKVLKVRDETPSGTFDDIHENLPQMPSLTLIIGSVRSGKSNLLVNFFCNSDFYKDKFDIVKFVSTTLHTDNKGKILSKHFDCMDRYEDDIIDKIMKSQSQYESKEDKFLELYDEAHKDRYSFLYLKLSENPAEAYVRFERKIYPTRDSDETEELEID